MWLVTIIKFLCYLIYFLLFFVLCIQIQKYGNVEARQCTEYADEATINTGDILGICYQNLFADVVTTLTGSVWMHAGVAWRDPKDNKLYILESADYDTPQYSGIIKMPFSTWMRFNKKCTMGISRLRGKKVDAAKIWDEWQYYLRTDFEAFSCTWHRFLQYRPYTPARQDRYTCFEIILELLQRCDVLKKTYACSTYLPKDLIKGLVPTEEGYKYETLQVLDTSNYILALKTK
jgi:hypothetical protein